MSITSITSIAYVRPPICLSITCSCFSSQASWGYAPFGGTATETNSGHRPVDEPWQTKAGAVAMAWALVIGVPVPRMTIWRLSEAHGSSIPLSVSFFDTKVATRNGLSTFEVQGPVEVPSVFELAAPPTCQNVKELGEVCMQWNQARNSSTVVQCRAQSQEIVRPLRKRGQTNPEEQVSIRTDMAKWNDPMS